MPTNEEGEFELVLGNKQLLSVFFIVVVLLGVFFTMGYIVGRNMSPAAGTQIAANRPPGTPLVVDPAGGSKPPPAPAPVAPDKPSPMPEPKPEPAKPAPEPPKPEPAKPKPEPVKPEPKPEPVKPKPEPPKPKPEPPKPEPAKSGGPGLYLQVAATTAKDADLLVKSLTKQGFAAMTSPVPDSQLVRVIVGPVTDMPKTRSGLEALGFKPIPRKM